MLQSPGAGNPRPTTNVARGVAREGRDRPRYCQAAEARSVSAEVRSKGVVLTWHAASRKSSFEVNSNKMSFSDGGERGGGTLRSVTLFGLGVVSVGRNPRLILSSIQDVSQELSNKKGMSLVSRRRFIELGVMAATLPFLSPGRLIATATAAVGKVSEGDPAAAALKYVEVASTAVRTDKMGVAGSSQICANCLFYKDSETPEWGGCALFKNRLVAEQGWCMGWVPARLVQ